MQQDDLIYFSLPFNPKKRKCNKCILEIKHPGFMGLHDKYKDDQLDDQQPLCFFSMLNLSSSLMSSCEECVTDGKDNWAVELHFDAYSLKDKVVLYNIIRKKIRIEATEQTQMSFCFGNRVHTNPQTV